MKKTLRPYPWGTMLVWQGLTAFYAYQDGRGFAIATMAAAIGSIVLSLAMMLAERMP